MAPCRAWLCGCSVAVGMCGWHLPVRRLATPPCDVCQAGGGFGGLRASLTGAEEASARWPNLAVRPVGPLGAQPGSAVSAPGFDRPLRAGSRDGAVAIAHHLVDEPGLTAFGFVRHVWPGRSHHRKCRPQQLASSLLTSGQTAVRRWTNSAQKIRVDAEGTGMCALIGHVRAPRPACRYWSWSEEVTALASAACHSPGSADCSRPRWPITCGAIPTQGNAAPTGEALPYLGAKPGCRGSCAAPVLRTGRRQQRFRSRASSRRAVGPGRQGR